MQIVSNYTNSLQDGVEINLGLEQLSQQSSIGLFHGYYWAHNQQYVTEQKEKNNFKKIGLLDLWSPTSITSKDNILEEHSIFDKIFCICPYTCEWLNQQINQQKYVYSLYPLNNIDILQQEKQFDVCYFGGLHSYYHYDCLKILKKFNYQFLSKQPYPDITYYNIPYLDKLKIISQCKAGITLNFYYEGCPHNIYKYDQWYQHRGFNNLPVQVPQFKARVHEMIICRTLVLCMKDLWNLIEDYYKPNEHFLYFNDTKELEEIIQDVKYNWDKYKPIADKAFKHLQQNHITNIRYQQIKQILENE